MALHRWPTARIRWPTAEGRPIPSPTTIVDILAQRLEADCGTGSSGPIDPILMSARIDSVLQAERGGESGSQDDAEASKRAWAISLRSPTNGRRSGAADLRWMTDEMLEALRQDFKKWATGPRSTLSEGGWKTYAAFLPYESPEFKTHRPIVPLVPTVGVAMRAMLIEHGHKLQPRWLNAESFMAGGDAEALGLGDPRSGESHHGR